jgi:hypothetical protein
MEANTSFNKMTSALVSSGIFSNNPFQLIDVGCSGGISSVWRVFEPNLLALGIDPVVSECNRLNLSESNKSVRYHPSFVGLPDDHEFVKKRGGNPPIAGNPWNRLSAQLASEILNSQTKKSDKLSVLNDWTGSDLADLDSKIGVDELSKKFNLLGLDFIKVDVDGFDMDVIISSEEIQRLSPVLGYALEVNFYGGADDSTNTFHNIDRYMRSVGFDLFDLSLRRYSSRALPARFEWDIPAQTLIGRPYQGDAIYLRDPLAKDTYGSPLSPTLSPIKLLKLACLFELFGLPDHAAELLVAYDHFFNEMCDVRALLDVLACEASNRNVTYDDLSEEFARNPKSFYRSS